MITRIYCDFFIEKKNRLCRRYAEWRADDGRLLCHTHRDTVLA